MVRGGGGEAWHRVSGCAGQGAWHLLTTSKGGTLCLHATRRGCHCARETASGCRPAQAPAHPWVAADVQVLAVLAAGADDVVQDERGARVLRRVLGAGGELLWDVAVGGRATAARPVEWRGTTAATAALTPGPHDTLQEAGIRRGVSSLQPQPSQTTTKTLALNSASGENSRACTSLSSCRRSSMTCERIA